MERNFKYLKGRKFYLSSRKKSIKESYPKMIRVVSNIKNDEMAAYIEDYGNCKNYDTECRVFVIKESDLFYYYTPLTPKGVATLQFCEDTITKDKLAAEALHVMEKNQPRPITVLPVVDEDGHAMGIVHITDLLRRGIV